MASKTILVKVVYVSNSHQEVASVTLPVNSTVEHAIKQSGILQKCSEIDVSKNAVGIYGKVVQYTKILQDQDRVEIYRPLTINPRRARRKRAEIQN